MNIVKLATGGAILGAAMLMFVGGASAQTTYFTGSYTLTGTPPLPPPITNKTPTTLVTLLTTAPASGCPCRAVVSYFLPVRSGGTRGAIDAWVSDNLDDPTFAASTNTFTINTNSQLSATDVSPVTYNDSEAVTFTLNAQGQQPVNKAEISSFVTGMTNYIHVYFTPDITPAG